MIDIRKMIVMVLVGILLQSKPVSAQPKEFNYEESKVPNYSLPDPLTLSNGKKVTDAETWNRYRRPEILELFQTHVYGKSPGRPAKMSFKVTSIDKKAIHGKGTRKQITVFFSGKEDGPKMDILLFVPNKPQRPVPTFVGQAVRYPNLG